MRTWLTLGVVVAVAVGATGLAYAAEPKAKLCWQCEATIKEVKAAEKEGKRDAMVVLLCEAEKKAIRIVSKVDAEYGRAWLVLAKVSWYFGDEAGLAVRAAKVKQFGTDKEAGTAKWLVDNPHQNPVARATPAPEIPGSEGTG